MTSEEDPVNGKNETLMGISLAFSRAGDAGAIYLGGVPNYMYYKERYLKNNPRSSINNY